MICMLILGWEVGALCVIKIMIYVYVQHTAMKRFSSCSKMTTLLQS